MTTGIPEQPATPPPPTQPPTVAGTVAQKKKISPLTAGFLGLIVGAGAVGGTWAIVANNGPDKPATFTLEGEFTLLEGASENGSGCEGTGGYDDIGEGTSVTVYGAAGEVIATGHLGESEPVTYGTCTFDVAVEGVPRGQTFYKVEVSHRGTVQLSSEEAENGGFVGTLG